MNEKRSNELNEILIADFFHWEVDSYGDIIIKRNLDKALKEIIQ